MWTFIVISNIVISNIVAVICSAILADRKGRSVGGWIFGGVMLGWFAVIILACLSDQSTHFPPKENVEKHYHYNQSIEQRTTKQIPTKQVPTKESFYTHRWLCHNCRNMIDVDPCPFCGQVFSVKSDKNNE